MFDGALRGYFSELLLEDVVEFLKRALKAGDWDREVVFRGSLHRSNLKRAGRSPPEHLGSHRLPPQLIIQRPCP